MTADARLLPVQTEPGSRSAYAFDASYIAELAEQLTATGSDLIEVTSPATAQPLGAISQSTPADVEAAFTRARAAQARWARVPLKERSAMLLRLHDIVLARQDEIMDLICWESGKARKHAFDEPLHVALTARYYARTAARHVGTQRRLGVIPGLTRAEVNYLPKGVVGIIAPWNYPFTLALCDGIAALAAGNAVVIKPDSHTVLTALLAAQLLREAGIPEGLWNVVAGPGGELGPPMIEAADYICFTGSTATGKHIASQCAQRLVEYSLELGGKNPMLILADADVDRAVEGAIRACFSNSGQLCVAMERLYVADEVYAEFVKKFVAAAQALVISADPGWETDIGSLISQRQLDTVTAHVADAVERGATVLTGGKARPDVGPYFYEPTILTDVTDAMRCYGEETFGPVVSIYRFSREDEAVERANEGSYGLNASIYSRDVGRARDLAAQIRCGTVNVNEAFGATFASIDAPMGGMGQSGQGRRQGAAGIRRFTDAQAVASQSVLRFAPQFGLDYPKYAAMMTTTLKLFKNLRRP